MIVAKEGYAISAFEEAPALPNILRVIYRDSEV